MVPFLKMHGLGNDFVVFDGRKAQISLGPPLARAIADRHRGIGCDQVIVIEQPRNGADARMRIYNADGGEVESCGNAARCVARLLMDEEGRRQVSLESAGGPIACLEAGGQVTVDMGVPRLHWREIPLSEPRDTIAFQIGCSGAEYSPLDNASAVNVGNPHCVLFVRDAERAPVETLGPLLERHSLFPQRTNVEFVQVVSRERLRMRVWERGAGMTLACGTGACASVIASQRRQLCGTRVDVELDGGELSIEWPGEGSPIFMTGPASLSFRGEIELEALA